MFLVRSPQICSIIVSSTAVEMYKGSYFLYSPFNYRFAPVIFECVYCFGNVFLSFLKFFTAIAVLKDKEPGSFIVRDSHSFRGAYGLAMKVATPPPSVLQLNKKGTVCLLSVL